MTLLRVCLAAAAALALVSCGAALLEPQVEEALRHVFVKNIPERTGQLLRQGLIYAFGCQRGPRYYTLDITLEETVYGLALSGEARSRLQHITYKASYVLTEDKTGKVLDKSAVYADSAFNILPATQDPALYYSTTVAGAYVRELAINQLVPLLKAAVAKALGAHVHLWDKPVSAGGSLAAQQRYPTSHPLPVEPNAPSPRWDWGKERTSSQVTSATTWQKTS